MKAKRTALVILATSFLVLADEVTISQKAATDRSPEAIAARKQAFIERTGGFIDISGEGPDIIIMDARSKKDKAAEIVQETISRVLRQGIQTRNASTNTNDLTAFSLAKATLTNEKALMVIVISEDGIEKPTLSVFPEDRIAVVNWTRLTVAATEKDAEDRTIKELWRAIGFLHGAGYSMGSKSVMQPITSLIELDANEWKIINPSDFPQMNKMATKFGVKRGYRIVYEKAVRTGVAPAPTNDYQKAVWDRVMAEKAAATNAPSATPRPSSALGGARGAPSPSVVP